MAFPAFLDTCVLYPAHLCDTLLRLAEAQTFRPLWSDDVLVELERNLVENAGLREQQVRHRIDEMRRAFDDATVTGYHELTGAMTCDEKDRHVLAAAVRTNTPCWSRPIDETSRPRALIRTISAYSTRTTFSSIRSTSTPRSSYVHFANRPRQCVTHR